MVDFKITNFKRSFCVAPHHINVKENLVKFHNNNVFKQKTTLEKLSLDKLLEQASVLMPTFIS